MIRENGCTGRRSRSRRSRLHRPNRLNHASHLLQEMQYEKRSFAVDVLECPRCSGPMRIVAAIHPPEAIREILDCLGLPSRAPPIARAVPEDADEPKLF